MLENNLFVLLASLIGGMFLFIAIASLSMFLIRRSKRKKSHASLPVSGGDTSLYADRLSEKFRNDRRVESLMNKQNEEGR